MHLWGSVMDEGKERKRHQSQNVVFTGVFVWEGRGAAVHNRGRKYQHDLLYEYLQSINLLNTSKDDIKGFVSL